MNMVEQLSMEIRKQIVLHRAKGYTFQQIADKLGVSKGSVANVMKEHEYGAYPEFTTPEDEFKFISGICADLRKHKIPIWRVYEAVHFLDRLRDMKVKSENLKPMLKVVDDIESDKVKKEVILDFAIRARAMEEETGIAIEDLPAKLNNIQEKISDGTAQLGKLNNEKAHVKTEIESLKQQRASIRNDVNTSSQRVSELVATEEYLVKYGADNVVKHVKYLDEILPKGAPPDDISRLYEIKNAVDSAGWSKDDALNFITNMTDMIPRRDKIRTELTALRQELFHLSEAVAWMSDLDDILHNGVKKRCMNCNNVTYVPLPTRNNIKERGEHLNWPCPSCSRSIKVYWRDIADEIAWAALH